ncbi:FadR/GntR family transcriptional regulator [Marinobacterium arenosum]|uniref:FadR/GntR family transcriptional regulator n=1 Tax=Marinobacterium arenosum TaxID=2862496 RepID=UPI001C938E94|nr:FCD domain-containing protein [Marinobacterium arenosum]MBY4675773.1 FCD domain-containing protein [Marinobacterium arenosum]
MAELHSGRQQLLTTLKARMASADLRPGEKMPSQRQLADEFALARSTVREVFTELESDGLIETRQGAASRCCNLLESYIQLPLEGLGDNLDFQLQVLEARAILEGEAAYFAARRASDRELAALAAEYERMQARSSGETTLTKAKADLRFHTMIAEASHHLLIISFSQLFYARYFNAIYGVLNRTLIRYGRYPDGIRSQHGQIHQALKQRDAETARQVAREHILYTRRLLEDAE